MSSTLQSRRRRVSVPLALAASAVAVFAGLVPRSGPPARASGAAILTDARLGGLEGGNSPIKHVIEIMVENHTFDNLFGNFPRTNGIPADASMLSPNAYYDSAPNVHPIWATPNEGDVQGAINNSAGGEQMAMDFQPGQGYQMDHYTVFPQDGMSAITEFGPQFDPNEQYLATNYELADNNFQPIIAPTQPNVMTALNGTDHGWVYNNLEPGATQPWNSIFDELTAHDRTWKIYYALPPSVLTGTIWNQIIPSGSSQDLTTGSQFLADLSAGNLPDFSFVRPGVGYSTEPPEDIGQGDAWIGQLVNAVAQSWPSTPPPPASTRSGPSPFHST
ncbi:MAG: phosphoesterase [Acidimicrobiaceae bacterium]|nr:phosphoesterase [Acidimicrobiaceae bacterium]